MAQQELNWISIDGFKSIASSGKVELGPINLIIGPNGSGKSNFIGVFAFLQAIKEGRLYEYVRTAGGADELLHFGTKCTPEIQIGLSFRNEVNGYNLTLKVDSNDNLFPMNEVATFWNKTQYHRPYSDFLPAMEGGKEAGISNPNLSQKTGAWVRARLDRWRLYHVHDTSASSPLRKTARVDDSDYLRPDGANLASFLYRLKQTEKYKSSYSLIRKTVQRVAPFFDDFLLRPDNLSTEYIKLAWKHKSSDKYFGSAAFSDGTLRFIALATLFLQPLELRPSVILVDEPELGLHPSAITLLASMMRPTEETFVNELLRPHLLARGFTSVSARLLGNARLRERRGGIKAWSAVKDDITRHLLADAGCFSTTMVDYYALPATGPKAWPGRAIAKDLPHTGKAQAVESAVAQDISTCLNVPLQFMRFIPYVVMHEFEALLFSDCSAFAVGVGRSDLAHDLQKIRDQFSSPEEINDSPETAPSKRVEGLIPGYQKPFLGNLAALEIGLPRMRVECPRFAQWLAKLEAITNPI